MAAIPQIYRDKIASSLTGTPGVDTSGQMIGQGVEEGVAPVEKEIVEQRAKNDEIEYARLGLQHKVNIDNALENIKKVDAANPEKATTDILSAIKTSRESLVATASNPRVKRLMEMGEPWAETFGVRNAAEWSSTQEYKNLDKKTTDFINDASTQSYAVGARQDTDKKAMMDHLASKFNEYASLDAEWNASRHSEDSPLKEKAAKSSMALSMLEGANEAHPLKAADLLKDPEFRKLLEVKDLKQAEKYVASSIERYPYVSKARQFMAEVNAREDLATGLLNGTKGTKDVEAAARRGDISEETVKDWASLATEGQSKFNAIQRATTQSDIFEHAARVASQFLTDPVSLVERDSKGNYKYGDHVEDLNKLHDSILKASGDKIITPAEAKQYLTSLYYPAASHIMFQHNTSLGETIKMETQAPLGMGEMMGRSKNLTPDMAKKMSDYQTASSVISEYIKRTGKTGDPMSKAKLYSNYLDNTEKYLKPNVINAKENAPWTPAQVAHATIGESIGSMYPTKFGLRPIDGYDKRGVPTCTYTKEDEEKMSQTKILADVYKLGPKKEEK